MPNPSKLSKQTCLDISKDIRGYLKNLQNAIDPQKSDPKSSEAQKIVQFEISNFHSLAKVFDLSELLQTSLALQAYLSTDSGFLVSDHPLLNNIETFLQEISPVDDAPTKKPETPAPAPVEAAHLPDKFFDETQQIIREEIVELTDKLELEFTELEQTPLDQDLTNSAFRTLHTIKGSAGMGGMVQIKDVSHSMEQAMELIRSKKLDLTDYLIGQFFKGIDLLRHLQNEEDESDRPDIDIPLFNEKLKAIVQTPPSDSPNDSHENEPEPIEGASNEKAFVPSEISADLKSTVPKKSAKKGKTEETLRVGIEKLDYLQDCIGEFVICRNQLNKVIKDVDHSIEEFGVFRHRFEKIVSSSIDPIHSPDRYRYEGNTRGDIAQDNKVIEDFSEQYFGMVSQFEHLKEITDRVRFLSSKLQDGILRTRMVPISMLFNKYPRLVRDICSQSGKSAELKLTGAETELDKKLVDELFDAILHLVRNSIDHGIESPEERVALGKPRKGTIELKASHAENDIVIEIRDDGKGISVDSVRKTALDRGLVTNDELKYLDKNAILNFIFYPGFSTKSKVTELSGRGVGMDVVASKVARLKGNVIINSELDQGTVITITMPLTLAIIPALVLGVSDQKFAIPLDLVNETLWVTHDQVVTVGNRQAINVRENIITLLWLDQLLNLEPNPDNDQSKMPVVVVSAGDRQFGLVVDNLFGREEFVIKSFNYPLQKFGICSGATITGDGRAMLFLNIPELIRYKAVNS